MTTPVAAAGRIPRLRVLLPLELRAELVRRALEDKRSIEHQAEHILEQALRRSLTRRRPTTA
jgi:hypothetical protein